MYIERLAKSAQVSIDALKANLARERRKNNRVQSRTRQYKNYPNRSNNTVDTLIPPEQPIELSIKQTEVEKHPSQTRLLYLFIHSTEAQKYLLNGNFHFPDKEFEKLAELWVKYSETHNDPQINGFLDFIPEQLQGIIIDAELAKTPTDFNIQEINEHVHALKKRNIYSRLNELQIELQDAKRKEDAQEIIKITQEILGLKRILEANKEAF